MGGKPAGRLGDQESGHGCFPPTPCTSASGNVITNGKGAMRVGDKFATHCCPNAGCHPPVLASGSGTVKINGKAAGRLGDPTGCGAKVMVGSGNVLIGG